MCKLNHIVVFSLRVILSFKKKHYPRRCGELLGGCVYNFSKLKTKQSHSQILFSKNSFPIFLSQVYFLLKIKNKKIKARKHFLNQTEPKIFLIYKN